MFRFDQGMCDDVSGTIVGNTNTQIDAQGIKMLSPFKLSSCTPKQIKMCGTFFSVQEGAKLQPWIDGQLANALALVTGASCPSWLAGYTVAISVFGPSGQMTCLSGQQETACALKTPDFPKCVCNTKPYSTPFAALPTVSSMPGRTKDAMLHCFTTAVVKPSAPTSACGITTVLHKVEFFADDAMRRAITGIAVKPAGSDKYKYISASWGAIDEDTVKATPLNWSLAQSAGGMICLELTVPLGDFCMGDGPCWLNIFDEAKDCCPLFSASPLPY